MKRKPTAYERRLLKALELIYIEARREGTDAMDEIAYIAEGMIPQDRVEKLNQKLFGKRK